MTLNGHRSPTRPARPRAPLAVALAFAALAFLTPSAARAQVIIQALNSTAPFGGTGAFDVVLIDNDPVGSTTYLLNSFSVQLTVLAGSGITFTGADTNTIAASYVFGTIQSPPFTFDTFPTQNLTVSDFKDPGTSVPLGPGAFLGLAHITYAVAPGTPYGPVTVSLDLSGTSLTEANGNPITFTTTTGTISVVPEPGPLTLAGITGLAGLAVAACRRRRRGTASTVSGDA